MRSALHPTASICGLVYSYDSQPLSKNFLRDYAAEHFEIASYRSLVSAAQDLNHPEIAVICEEILMEEESMADWIEAKIPDVTRMMLQQIAHA